MKVRKSGSWVLWYEGVGFSLIILFAWLNELADLPRRFLGGAVHARDLTASVFQTLIVLMIWFVVFRLTRRLLARLHYLEGFLRVCAWCRKVGHEDRWMLIEQYFADGFQIHTTHGMCPDCLKKIEEDTAQFRRDQAARQNPQPHAEAA